MGIHLLRKICDNIYSVPQQIPPNWIHSPCSDETRQDVLSLFKYKATLFIHEITSALLTPLLLIFVLPSRVEGILQFIRDNTMELPGIGEVCSYSINQNQYNPKEDDGNENEGTFDHLEEESE